MKKINLNMTKKLSKCLDDKDGEGQVENHSH